MADNKKITPLNVQKVKRGVKGALTPGEQPEKEQTPIEKVISREIAKIVEDINFDAKFESIKTAIESRHSESLLPVLEKINDKLNPILGALYGVSNVDDNTSPTALLSKLGNLDPKLTMFGPIDSMLKSIYELLITQISNKYSYKLEDLAIAVSAEIAKFLKEIDSRPALESLTKTLEEMKSSILSNSSAENINRIYSQLEVISNLLSNNNTIDYTIAISDVASKINNIANAISSNNSIERQDNLKFLDILNGISSAVRTMSKTTSENIVQSTNVLREVSEKLSLINTETAVVDNSLLIDELKDIKQILINDIVSNYKQKTNTIDYSDALNSINESIKNIVAYSNNTQNVENNQINSTTVNELKNISESITNLASSIVTNNYTTIELQNISNAISELSTSITNSSSITEIVNRLTEITKKMSIENIDTNMSSIEQYINSISSSISTISEINTSISSINESIIELNRILRNNTQNFTKSIRQSVNEQIRLMSEIVSSVNAGVEHTSNIESNIVKLSRLVNDFPDVITNSNISQIENISNSIKESISNVITENNSAINSLINEFTQSIQTSIQSITSNLSNLNNIDNSSVASDISNSLTALSNTLDKLALNVTKLTDVSNTNIANINESINNISTVIQNVISKGINTNLRKSLNDISSNISYIKSKVKTIKLPEQTSENYDYIIESINDSTNSIIDIISEKFDDILDPIKKLVNTNDFNLRTAQIIDAINPSTKDVNTKALQYDININASGLNSDTIEALIDLSNISTDSTDYLENLNNVLSNLSNFEVLNNIKLDNKNIKNIVDSISVLSEINLREDAFNPLSVDRLKYFIDTLSSIDLSTINKFDEDSLKSISIIIDTLRSFSNLKLENFNRNIQSINADEFVKLLNALKDIPVYDKENKTTMTSISDLFSAISSISEFDEYKFENLSSNLRSMIKLTEKPDSFNKFSDRGLIHILMHNIGEIAAEKEQTFDNTKNIDKMLNLICSISQYDTNLFDNLKSISYTLAIITSKDEPYLYKVFKNIEELGDVISGWDKNDSPVLLIGNQLKLINNLSSKIKLKNISSLAVKSIIAWNAMYTLSKMFDNLREIVKSSNDVEENIKLLNDALVGINSIESIDLNKIENLNESLKALIVSSIYLRILALIPSKEIDISKNITVLNNIVEQLNSLKEVKGKDNFESLNDSIKSILTLNIWLAIVGITMPLAYIGAFAIDKEISMLSKIVGKLNEIEPIKEDVVNNLKSLAIVIVAASGILLFGALVGGFVSTHLLEILGFTVALSAFIFLTIGALNLATRGMKEAKLNVEEFGKLLLISGGIMLLGGAIMVLYSPLILGALAFSVTLGAFIFLTIGALNLATKGMNDAAKNAKEFAILIGVCAATMLIGGLIILNYTKIILGSLGFSLLLGAFIFLTIGALNLATKGMNDAAKNAKEFAIIIGVCAATMLIGGLFMLIPGMPLAVLEFAGIFVLFLGITLFAYALASKHIKEAKQAAIGFGIVVLLTSMALLLGGGLFLAFHGLDMECLKFAGISALFIAIFGVAIWLLGKIKKKDLIQGELALAGIAVLIGGFGYAFTFVAEAMDMMSKVKDPWTQLGIMGTVFGAMVALVVGVVTLTTTTAGIGAAAIAAAEGLIAGVAGIIWLVGKAMSAIAQSMVDLDKVKDFDSENVVKAISNYISLIPELMPLASPEILISMLAVKSSVGSMSEAILAIATSVKTVCDLKTEDGRQLTSSDFTLAAENVKSVVTILGRSLIDIYKENEDMFSAGTIGDLLGMDTPFSRVAKSCSTMGQLITDISAGVKDFAELRMPIYDENGKIKGYREMTEKDFEKAGKSIGQVVTCLGGALIDIYKESPEMFTWELIGDNPFAMVSKSCSTMGQLITDISAGVKDFAELRMPIYDENGKIKGYREMNTVDFINAGTNVGLVLTCLASAIMAVYNDPNNKDMFTDPSNWHTSADKTPFGMVTKAMGGVGTLVKDGAAAIKEIADMKVDFKDLEGENGKVAKIVSILASSIMGVYNKRPELFTDDSFFHTDPQKTKFGMVMQCLNTLGPFVKVAASTINDISQLNFKSTDLNENGELYKKINGIVSVLPKAVIDIMTNKAYEEYLTDSDYLDKYENMKSAYSKFSEIINAVIKSYESINNAGYNTEQITGMKNNIELMLKSLCEVITSENNNFNNPILKNSTILSGIASSFGKFNEVIEKVNTAYDSIVKSLSSLGVKGNDTTVITTITDNLNTMVSKLSTAIKLNIISLDTASVNSFSTNASSFYSSIETLTNAYKLIPNDLSNYDNVVKAMGGINSKISEISNLEEFNAEQKTLENYVITLNNLDLNKVQTLSNLMSIMNELATKLGSLDKFTDVLNTKISMTLSKLANQIKVSGDIINKADSLQKQRHEAIKASIKEIQSIMDQKLIVEVNHNEIQSNSGDFFMDSYGNGNFGNGVTPNENAGNAIPSLFGGNNNSNSTNNASKVANTSYNVGGIDYDRLRTVIFEAITQASGSGIDIDRR